MTVTASEGEFQGDVIQWANEIIKQDALPFDEVTQLPGVRIGRKRREPDLVLWLDRAGRRAFCEIEIKQPYYSAMDAEVVAGAAAKADQIGAPYFITWNVTDLVLWDRGEVDLPLLRRSKVIEHVTDIRDIEEVHEPGVRDDVRTTLRRVLRRLAALHEQRVPRESVFQPMPPDENFVDMVHSYVHALGFYLHYAIRKRAADDKAFRRKLARWFKDQGWSADLTDEGYAKAARQSAHILLNKILFYDALRAGYPGRLPELRIGSSVKGDDVRRTLKGYFDMALGIDYEAAFASHLLEDELEYSEEVASQLQHFVEAVTRWELRDLRYDVIGRVFERLVPLEERKWLGQFFTRSDLVDLIIGFCVKSPDGPFMDPACGAGTFLVRLYSRLKHLKPDLGHQEILERLWGFDIAAFPAHLATINLYLRQPRLAAFPRVLKRDFFSIFPGDTAFAFPFDLKGGMTANVPAPRCQAVLGNPPYTRQEELEEISSDTGDRFTYKGRVLEVLDRDFGRGMVQLSRRAGIYAHFFLHGASFLAPGGRLAFVTSNSWLDADYGADIQRFFLERFKVIAILDSRCERWFEDADVNTAITVVEECADEGARSAHPVRFVSIKRPLAELVPASGEADIDGGRWHAVDQLVTRVEETDSTFEDTALKVRVVRQGDLRSEGWDDEQDTYVGAKWGKYLRAPDVYFEVLGRAAGSLVPLSSAATVRRGFTTGANDFFFVKDVTDRITQAELHLLGAPKRFPKHLRVIEAGDGSHHLLEAEFLIPSILRVGHIGKPRFDAGRLDKKLVMVNRPRTELRRTWAIRYIRWGEEPHPHRDPRQPRSGYHQRETCAARDPWWNLGARKPAPVLYPIAHKRRPVVGLNTAGVQTADNFLDIVPRRSKYCNAVAASLFSTFSQLQAEVEGRVNFGEGVLKTQAADVRKLSVLDPEAVEPELLARVLTAFEDLADRRIELVWDEVKRADRQHLDDVILEAFGFDDPEERRRVRNQIYEALCALIRERMEKPKTVKSKRSSSARLDIVAMAESVIHDEIEPEERRDFPRDFIPLYAPSQVRQFPEGNVSVTGGDLFDLPAVKIGDDAVVECQSAVEARYLAYAIRCSGPEVLVPTDRDVVAAAVDGYEAYLREISARLDQVIGERTSNKRIARAVRQEALRLLRITEPIA
jgi:type I restriction-modification system DNA methylase subunit